MSKPREPVEGIVQRVFRQKRYVLCTVEGLPDKVTFNLSVWTGQSNPIAGQVALLSEVTQHKKGWRAAKAGPKFLPTPQQPAKSQATA